MPEYRGFCGPSNTSQSPLANCERTINWFPEAIESRDAPSTMALYPTPGIIGLHAVPEIGGRALFTAAGRAFAINGASFYELFSDSTYTLRGTVALDTNPATISYNGIAGDQLFITSGGNGYCYDLSTNTLTTELTGDATMGGMLNARFLAFDVSTGKVRLSALNDGTTWDPTLFFQRTQGADPWQSMLVKPSEIWLIGEQSGEVWYDTGAFPQPFAPIPGAFFMHGTVGPFAAAIAGEQVVWLSRTKDGAGSIVAARGYTPQPISSLAVETAIHGYARDFSITDCEALVYEQAGHLFVSFSFPSANATWTCDLKQGMAWHERGRWDSANGRFTVWQPRVHCYAFGRHIVGLRGFGGTHTFSSLSVEPGGNSIVRRLRIPPPLMASSRQRLQIDRLQVLFEPGQDHSPLGTPQAAQVMLRTSTNTKTWGAERTANIGVLGDYNRRVVWHRCGSSDFLWVPEISVTDAVPWRISGALIDGAGFQAA